MKIDSSFLFDCARELYSNISYNNNDGKILLPPLRYIFELTYRCNLQCPFCYLGEKKKLNELTAQQWYKIIDQIPKYAFISLLGGEVLLRKDFIEIFKYCSNRVMGKVNVFSNGTLYTEDIIDEMMNFKSLLFSVSIDGIGEKHDNFRKQKGAYDKALKSLQTVEERRKTKGKKYPLLEIKTVILNENLDELPKLYKLCTENNINFITFSFLRTTDIRQNQNMRECFSSEFSDVKYPIKLYFDMEHFEEVYKELESMAKHSKTLLRWAPKFSSVGELEKIKSVFNHCNDDIKTMYKPCKFPWHDVFINPEGVVYPCLPVKIGSLTENKLMDVLNNEKFLDFRKRLKRDKIFEPCHLCCDLYPKKIK